MKDGLYMLEKQVRRAAATHIDVIRKGHMYMWHAELQQAHIGCSCTKTTKNPACVLFRGVYLHLMFEYI